MSNDIRVPAGRPTGGQFAAHQRGEADITLAPEPRLSDAQQKLLDRLPDSEHPHGDLVSGHEYRTALALERRGLATVRYQGSSRGWVKSTTPPKTATYNRYVNDPNTAEVDLHARQGQTVALVGEPYNADPEAPEENIMMQRIRFADGLIAEAFLEELTA